MSNLNDLKKVLWVLVFMAVLFSAPFVARCKEITDIPVSGFPDRQSGSGPISTGSGGSCSVIPRLGSAFLSFATPASVIFMSKTYRGLNRWISSPYVGNSPRPPTGDSLVELWCQQCAYISPSAFSGCCRFDCPRTCFELFCQRKRLRQQIV